MASDDQSGSPVAQLVHHLALAGDAETVAFNVAAAFDELLGTEATTVWGLDPAAQQLRALTPAREQAVPLDALSEELQRCLNAGGTEVDPLVGVRDTGPLAQGPGYVAPLVSGGRVLGLVVAPAADAPPLDGEVHASAGALAALGGGALDRQELQNLHLRHLEVLYQLSASLAQRPDAPALRGRLQALLAPEGYELDGIVFHQRDIARHLGGGEQGDPRDGAIEVPMRVGDRVVGALRVRLPEPAPPAWRSFLDALAAGVGQVAARAALRAALEQAHGDRLLAQERERITREVHETVGIALEAIDARMRRFSEAPPGGVEAQAQIAQVAGLADGARWELEQALRALAYVPGPGRGLGAALRGLAGRVEADSGIAVVVDMSGQPARLPPRVERAVYRVASEAMVAAWRYGRCSLVRISLSFAVGEVTLTVQDDGVTLEQRRQSPTAALGFDAVRRAAAEVGGRLQMVPGEPHGIRVQLRVARSRR